MRRCVLVFLLAALETSSGQTTSSGSSGPKVLLYYDMEGISGVHRSRQTLHPNPEYQEARRFLTGDVNAAIRGLKAGGAGEIVVVDSHGSGSPEPDILLNEMDSRASHEFRDQPFDPYRDSPGASYRAIVCIGMHARGGSKGVLAHTFGPAAPSVKVNGILMTETHIVGLSAARFGIPVIMVSGDDVLEGQLGEEFPQTEYAVVKKARGHQDAELLSPAEAQGRIERAAEAAIRKLGKIRPYSTTKPFQFEITSQNRGGADYFSVYPGAKRINDLTVSYAVDDFIQGYRRLMLPANAALGLLIDVVASRPDGRQVLAEWERQVSGYRSPYARGSIGPDQKTRYHGF